MVMFPPWQLHSVLPSDYQDRAEGEQIGGGRQLRVSWAFNLMAKSTRRLPPMTAEERRPGELSTAMAMEKAQEDLLEGLLDEL